MKSEFLFSLNYKSTLLLFYGGGDSFEREKIKREIFEVLQKIGFDNYYAINLRNLSEKLKDSDFETVYLIDSFVRMAKSLEKIGIDEERFLDKILDAAVREELIDEEVARDAWIIYRNAHITIQNPRESFRDEIISLWRDLVGERSEVYRIALEYYKKYFG